MLNYYELKAVDVGDNFEGDVEGDDPFFYPQRRPSWELKMLKDNKKVADGLNDSRDRDFDGLEEYF